mmetsp:Transcript_45648/g.87316  ORF Transcript_45648/g.87316 Transcript_45648/m.87316 type:complete len:668 (-) Transcript_45648:369-2372(-)
MVVTAFPILAWLWHGSKELLGIMQHTKCVIAHKINFFSLRQWPWHHASRCIITFAPHLIPFIGPCSAFCMSPHITWFIIVRKPGSAHVNHWDLMFLIPRRRIVYIPHLQFRHDLVFDAELRSRKHVAVHLNAPVELQASESGSQGPILVHLVFHQQHVLLPQGTDLGQVLAVHKVRHRGEVQTRGLAVGAAEQIPELANHAPLPREPGGLGDGVARLDLRSDVVDGLKEPVVGINHHNHFVGSGRAGGGKPLLSHVRFVQGRVPLAVWVPLGVEGGEHVRNVVRLTGGEKTRPHAPVRALVAVHERVQAGLGLEAVVLGRLSAVHHPKCAVCSGRPAHELAPLVPRHRRALHGGEVADGLDAQRVGGRPAVVEVCAPVQRQHRGPVLVPRAVLVQVHLPRAHDAHRHGVLGQSYGPAVGPARHLAHAHERRSEEHVLALAVPLPVQKHLCAVGVRAAELLGLRLRQRRHAVRGLGAFLLRHPLGTDDGLGLRVNVVQMRLRLPSAVLVQALHVQTRGDVLVDVVLPDEGAVHHLRLRELRSYVHLPSAVRPPAPQPVLPQHRVGRLKPGRPAVHFVARRAGRDGRLGLQDRLVSGEADGVDVPQVHLAARAQAPLRARSLLRRRASAGGIARLTPRRRLIGRRRPAARHRHRGPGAGARVGLLMLRL